MAFGEYDIGDEYVGDDLDALLGDDGEMEIGSVRSLVRGAKGGGRQMTPAGGPVRVRTNPYTKNRRFPIGFSGGSIAASASSTITSRPQVPFMPQRVIVPSSISAAFTIDDIKVGNKSQLVSAGSIPAAVFSELSVDVELKGDTCGPAVDLILVATNVSGGAVTFRAAVIGIALET